MGEPENDPGAEAPPQSEEELRARVEEGLRKVRVQDVLLESIVTVVNLTARRIAKEDERDLEQARIGIDAVRALVDLLEPEAKKQVQAALSELQMLFAREAGGDGPETEPQEQAPPEPRPGPGLWTPPGSA